MTPSGTPRHAVQDYQGHVTETLVVEGKSAARAGGGPRRSLHSGRSLMFGLRFEEQSGASPFSVRRERKVEAGPLVNEKFLLLRK